MFFFFFKKKVSKFLNGHLSLSFYRNIIISHLFSKGMLQKCSQVFEGNSRIRDVMLMAIAQEDDKDSENIITDR